MVSNTVLALNDAAEWLGNWHPLAEQLGSADGLVELGSISRFLALPPVHDRESLLNFIANYHSKVLLPFEFPAIEAAHGHVSRTEVRELVALDQELAAKPLLEPFAAASRRVGQAQMQKLRPLRDQRVVQRYLNAIESGAAHGWHTLVYGLTLAIYSLPLRQGLLGYAHQVTRSFIYSGARLLRMSEKECRQMFDETTQSLGPAVEAIAVEPFVAI
jgi:urease accessory protein UreF